MIPINYTAAVAALGRNASVRIANGVRPPDRYLLQTLLPDREVRSYHAEDANLKVITTIAGPTAMDAPYAPVGSIQGATWSEGTIKATARYELTEEHRRQIRQMMETLFFRGVNAGGLQTALETEVLNIQNKLIQQSMWDYRELLRAKALVTGGINQTFGDKTISVTYGIPAGNFLPNRTGTAAWDGPASGFWNDIASIQTVLRFDVFAYIAHPTTITKIVGNTANNCVIVGDGNWLYNEPVTLQRMDTNNGFRVVHPDGRFKVTLIPYAEEYEIFDLQNPGKTIRVPFFPTGKLLGVGNNRASEYRVGQGSTDDPNASLPLGYTHHGPTEEGNGVPGDWLNMFVPQDMPMQVNFRGACNFLPVVQAPEKVCVASSDLTP